tara:strand:- start:226 stop:585 length:360 start_codon:yes stop_codon:yes gene_type:complete
MSGRGAGNIFRIKDDYFRPIQYNPTYYGQGLIITKIITLSPKEFREEIYFKWENSFIHHITIREHFMCIDWNCRALHLKNLHNPFLTRTHWNKLIKEISLDRIASFAKLPHKQHHYEKK